MAGCHGPAKCFGTANDDQHAYGMNCFRFLGESVSKPGDRLKRKSRLSKTLAQVLQDSSALGYFIQYLEKRNVSHLVKFWLDAKSFRVSAEAAVRSVQGLSVVKEKEVCAKDDVRITIGTPVDPDGRKSWIDEGWEMLAAEYDSSKPSTSKVFFNCEKHLNSPGICQMTCLDAIEIYRKYLSREAHLPVGLTSSVRNAVIEAICNQDSRIDPECFVPAQDFVFRVLEKRYFPEFPSSVYHCKHVIDVLTSGDVFLSDVIYNDTAMFYFNEFMDQLSTRDLFEFCLAADHFRTQDQDAIDSSVIQMDAMIIYDRYFSLQASNPLGFPDEMRREVEQRICSEDGHTSLSCFDRPLQMLWNHLERTYLPNFLKSNLYMNYLTELIGKIENNLDLPPVSGHKTRRTASYAASDISSGGMSLDSSQSLPSASSGTTARRRRWFKGSNPLASKRQNQLKKVSSDTLSFDMRQSESPDLLYKRSDTEQGLSLGRIDGMGSFVRGATGSSEEELAIPSSNRPGVRLKNALRKMVHRKEDPLEKEIAEKVAQLILSDIQEMTQTGDNATVGQLDLDSNMASAPVTFR